MYARKRFFHSVTQVSQSVPSETGIVRLVEATCKSWSCQHTESCPTGIFRLPWLRCFPCSPLIYKANNQGIRRSDGPWPAPPSGTVGPLKCLTFAASLTFRHDQSGFESQKGFQPKLCLPVKVYCLLSNGPRFAQVDIFKPDGKIVCVSAIPSNSLIFNLYLTFL